MYSKNILLISMFLKYGEYCTFSMKKLNKKRRQRDVLIGIKLRVKTASKTKKKKNFGSNDFINLNNWLKNAIANGLKIGLQKKRNIVLKLPEKLNFNYEYEITTLNLMAIRILSSKNNRSQKNYRLSSVDFDRLRSISTSAALVLTAELAKWDDDIRQGLIPKTDNWDPDIFRKLSELGFFDMFKREPTRVFSSADVKNENVNLVRYIKGKCGDSRKTRELKQAIIAIVGQVLNKWTFLHSGIDEAITNVTHHAYPANTKFFEKEKQWYLTGSYNTKTLELKIVFYDQGIGIPRSLPTSKVWEKALSFLAKLPSAERRKDEAMLKAAVQLDRTSTAESDRGKGLQDLLEFVRKRQDGYLSILSAKGLYKLTINEGVETVKTEHFYNAVHGTLIIWSVTLG